MKTTITINGKVVEIELTEEQVKKIKGESGRWRAEEDSPYWYILDNGEIFRDVDQRWRSDNDRYKIGNYFKTKEEAERKAGQLRAILMPQTYVKGGKFWYWDFDLERVALGYCEKTSIMKRKFATKEEAQAWGDEFVKYFI